MTYWTQEKIDDLSTRWNNGQSASVIARALGDGVSRSAVIGKVHRIGLPKRQSTCRIIRLPSRRPPKQRVAPALRSVKTPPPEPPSPATALRLTLMQLTDATCKCGLGDPKNADFAFCGLPVKQGSAYCPGHHGQFYSSIRTEKAKRDIKKTPRRGRAFFDFTFERYAA
jgi:GcrA cell cycle regulator